jgi:hypothetical protein
LYPLLGITIHGIPLTFHNVDVECMRDMDENLVSNPTSKLEEEYPNEICEQILDAIHDVINQNRNLPDGPHCSDPKAEVEINTSFYQQLKEDANHLGQQLKCKQKILRFLVIH